MLIPEAIAREEGWEEENSRCRRNHNPGNIEYGSFAIAHGGTLEKALHARFAVFPTDDEGFAALRARLAMPPYRGMTITAMVTEWAPSNENNTRAYIQNVCEFTGLSPDTVIDRYIYPAGRTL